MIVKALIPAYNEEKTIGNIIDTLKKVTTIDDILVVDDGSKDNTYQEADTKGANVIKLEKNQGKGAAIMKGINDLEADILLLLDGDLIGLKPEHVYSLLNPVLSDEADMTIGIFKNGRRLTDLAQTVSPNLSGQRAIKLKKLREVKNLDKEGFGVEVALNKFFKNSKRVRRIPIQDVTHVMKEEKMGLKNGILARAKMYIDIIKTLIKNLFK